MAEKAMAWRQKGQNSAVLTHGAVSQEGGEKIKREVVREGGKRKRVSLSPEVEQERRKGGKAQRGRGVSCQCRREISKNDLLCLQLSDERRDRRGPGNRGKEIAISRDPSQETLEL